MEKKKEERFWYAEMHTGEGREFKYFGSRRLAQTRDNLIDLIHWPRECKARAARGFCDCEGDSCTDGSRRKRLRLSTGKCTQCFILECMD